MRLAHARARRTGGVLLAAAIAQAGCSVLIGVAGDPVVVGDEDGGAMRFGAIVESGADADAAVSADAASAHETDAGVAVADGGTD